MPNEGAEEGAIVRSPDVRFGVFGAGEEEIAFSVEANFGEGSGVRLQEDGAHAGVGGMGRGVVWGGIRGGGGSKLGYRAEDGWTRPRRRDGTKLNETGGLLIKFSSGI